MQLSVRQGLRIESIGGEAILLDRSGAAVHHLLADGAEALELASTGVDEAAVPPRLASAMAELVEAGLVVGAGWSRRSLLKAAGAGVAGAALVTVGLPSSAAAASGSVSGVPLVKTINGNNSPDPPLDALCLVGGVGNSGRGTCVFTRTESPATISVTIVLSTGTSAVGRDVFILQSVAPGTSPCLGGTLSSVGVWAASPALGPQTFTAPIITGADRFVIGLQLSGGGGVDGWSSYPVVLP